MVEDLPTKQTTMLPLLEDSLCSGLKRWSVKGKLLPLDVLEEIKVAFYQQESLKRKGLHDDIRECPYLKITPKKHQGKPRIGTWNEAVWRDSIKETRQESVYFIAGVPLVYWSFGGTPASAGYSLGCAVPELQRVPEKQGLKALYPFRARTHGGTAGFEWLTEETAQKFELLGGLPTFSEWRKKDPKWRTRNELAQHHKYVRFLRKKEQAMIDGKYSFT
jgi:hypothetical protein